MNCKELVDILGDYVDGTMAPGLKEEFSEHIRKCEACLSFLKSYDRTRLVARDLRPQEMPEEMRLKLRSFVLKKAREQRQDVEKYLDRISAERVALARRFFAAWRDETLPSSAVERMAEHARRCAACNAIVSELAAGGVVQEPSSRTGEHVAEILDSLPAGENPFYA
jgi:anti-sigma factor RsiW